MLLRPARNCYLLQKSLSSSVNKSRLIFNPVSLNSQRFLSVTSIKFSENPSKSDLEQDGPSLESSSYLNVTLRYLGPGDPWTLGPSSISYYLLVCYGLEWGGVSDDYGPF